MKTDFDGRIEEIITALRREGGPSPEFLKKSASIVTLDSIAALWSGFAADIHRGDCAPNPHVYVHTPFCVSRCKYCAYESYILKDRRFVERHLKQLELEASTLGGAVKSLRFSGVYFGGGTPSILEPTELARMLNAVFGAFSFIKNGLRTLEMRSDTATREKMALARDAGINRISFGVQSNTEEVLRLAARPVKPEVTAAAIAAALECGFDVVNADMIAPLPGETMRSFISSMKKLASFGPDSIVLYRCMNQGDGDYKAWDNPDFSDCGVISETFAALMDKAGYDVRSGFWSSFAVRRNRAGEELFGERMNYERKKSEPRAILGLGALSKSDIFGRALYYNCGRKALTNEPGGEIFYLAKKDVEVEARLAMADCMASGSSVSAPRFERMYGIDPTKFFSGELDFLTQRGAARFDGDSIAWTEVDAEKRSYLSKIFLSAAAADLLKWEGTCNFMNEALFETAGFVVVGEPFANRPPIASAAGFHLYYNFSPLSGFNALNDHENMLKIIDFFKRTATCNPKAVSDEIARRVNDFAHSLFSNNDA